MTRAHRLCAIAAMHAALVASQNGCGSSNTGSLDLFSPTRQPAGSNGPDDGQARGAGGQAPDAHVVPPVPGCSDSGCPADECRIDGDCHSGSASRCDIGSSRCVECLGAPDCAGGERPLCDTALHACAECLVDADCADPSKPGCFKPTGRCEECSADTHCGGGETCDLTDGHCR
jgi:hypothetical protein